MTNNFTPNLKRIKYFIPVLMICLALLTQSVRAQNLVTQTESFESTIFPAPGWKLSKGNTVANIGGNGIVQRQAPPVIPAFPVNVGSCPGGGSSLMSYNSGTAINGDTTYIISKPFDFSNNSGVNPTLSFYMFRDGFNVTSADRIEVLVNTVPSATGATLLTNTFATTAINRNNTFAPVAVANTWNQYTYSLNAGTYTAKKNYFIIRCIRSASNPGLDMFFDLFVNTTFPSATLGTDVSMTLAQQNQATIGVNQTNQWIVAIQCVVGGNSGCGNLNLGTALKLDSLLLNSNGTTNINDIQNAKIWYTGGSNNFSTNYISPFPTSGIPAGTSYPKSTFGATIPVIGTNMDFINSAAASCFYLEYDTTYFWLTYDVKSTGTTGNLLDADFRSANVGATGCPVALAGTGTKIIPGNFTLSGSASIDLPYCIPGFISGTSQNFFSNNDYIYSTFLVGSYGSVINTGVQTLALQNPLAPGYPNNHFVGYPPYYELMGNGPGRSAILTQGATYSITVGVGTWYNNNVIAAWIDFNRNGVFDASEKLGEANLTALGTTTWNFTVPGTGYVGPTRMRVREVFAQNNIQPCNTYTYGETEDYAITIVPICAAGAKIWLGNTDDWNDPANWCGGLPTINDDVIISKAQVNPVYDYKNSVIKSGVIAKCKNLSIYFGDTLIVNAASPGSLKIQANLNIYGAFKIVSNYNADVKLGNGSLTSNIITPFKSQSTDSRMQVIYTAAELATLGVQAGDRIKALKFDITAKSSTGSFSGFTVSYGLTATSAFASATPLATPNTVFGPSALNTTSGLFTITLTTPIVWDGINNLVIQYCFDNASSVGPSDDRLLITETTGRNSTLLLNTSTNAASGCGLTFPLAGVTSNFFPSLASSRPNTIFIVDRVYSKYVLTVQGFWLNDNYFLAGGSRVVMDSTAAQIIGGSEVTTFHELEINKTSAANNVALAKSIVIEDTLALYSGQFIMSMQSITINNATSLKAIDRTAGAIVCEDNSFGAKVNWNFGTLTGVHEIPFGTYAYGGNPVGEYIPVRINNTTGVDLGVISASTYITGGLNTPWPPTVTQINSAANALPPAVPGTNNAAFTVNRFWNISKTGVAPSPSTTLQFFFTDAERPSGATMSIINQPKAQPWNNAISAWQSPVASGTFAASPSTNSSTVANYNWAIGNSIPWTIALGQQPLGAGITLPVITVNSITPESCPGTNNGAINISVSGGASPYAYLWSNGANTEDLNGLITGPYTVTVTDSNGGTATVSVNVPLASQLPGTLGPISGPSSVCVGTTQVYSVNPIFGVSNYQWTEPPGAIIVSGQGTTQITLSISPTFVSGSLCVVASNSCGSSNNSCLLINASGAPATPGTMTGTAFGVCNSTKAYSVPNVVGVTYTWTVPAGANIVSGQSTNAVTIHFTNSFTNGTISVVAQNICGSSNARTKTVYGRPAKPTVINGPTTFCVTDTTIFSTPTVFGTTLYAWTVPAGLTIVSGQGTILIKVIGTGVAVNGSVCVRTENACGVTGYYCKSISGSPLPNQIATITGTASGVCGLTKTYTVPAQTGVTFNWTLPLGATIISGQGTRSVNVAFSSSFTNGVISVFGSSLCANSNTATKTIYGTPTSPTTITGPSTVCSNQQNVSYTCSTVAGATSYTWTVPSGVSIVSGQGSNTVVLNFNPPIGTPNIKVKSVNACGTSNFRILNLTLLTCPRIGDMSTEDLSLFPNPAQDEVTLYWYNDQQQKVEINCVNVLGQNVLSSVTHEGSGEQHEKLNTSSLSDGVYFVQFSNGVDKMQIRKLVISR